MTVLELNTAKFERTISKGVTLVDFWATWCPPCRIQGPILDELSKKTDGEFKIGKVDVDNQRELASKFAIRSIPTLILFKDGEPVETMVGVQTEGLLKEKINKLI